MAVVTTNLGTITAYGDAVAAGYTGTKAQWQALMANYATVGQQAAQDAQTASQAAQTATTKADEASQSATAAAASAASITTPDATLTQAGVAADAKATGDEISDLKEDLGDTSELRTTDKNSVVDAVNEIAGVVYSSTVVTEESENLYNQASEIMLLSIGTTSFAQASTLKGFYVPVADLQGQEVLIRRTNIGTRFRGVFTVNVPAVDGTFQASDKWQQDGSRNYIATVPSYANYLYVAFYNSSSDSLTEAELLDGMKITKMNQDDLYEHASDEMMLTFGSNVFESSDSLYGFYVPVNKNICDRVYIKRNNIGARFRYAYSTEVPAVGVTYTDMLSKDSSNAFYANIPDNVNYLYVVFYSSQSDTLTKAEALEGMSIRYVMGNMEVVTRDNVSKIEQLFNTIASAYSPLATYSVGDYAVYNGSLYRCTTAVTTAESFDANKWAELSISEKLKSLESSSVSVDTTLRVANMAADSASVGKQIYDAGTNNLYDYRSDSMLLSLSSGKFAQGTTLYGFYVPVDPSINNVVTIRRSLAGTRFRAVASADIPAVGVSFDGRIDRDTYKDITFTLAPTDRYLYVCYYGSTSDTLTESELLAGMSIYYGDDFTAEESRIHKLDYIKNCDFKNGNIDAAGEITESDTHIISNPIRVNGRFGVSCPSEYVIDMYAFGYDGKFIFKRQITNTVVYITHYGMVYFVIANSDTSTITPNGVDYSKIKLPLNEYSAGSYTRDKTFVLNAENCKSADVYAYIDRVVEAHGAYVTKTLLCTEASGLPIYYYTLGNGTKKAVIISGQHGPGSGGDPRDSVITLAKMTHDIIDGNFDNSSFLRTLHDDYTLTIIPVLNPYGFNNFSRYNYAGTDTNRDWTDATTIEVSSAKALILTINPFLILDVHCNGSTPIVDVDVDLQFGIGATHNPLYKNAVEGYFQSYYNTNLLERYPNTEDTLQHYIISTLGKLGGLLELRWWMKNKKWWHDYQAESANYNMLVNVIKYLDSVNDSETFVYEHTPNQNQY